MRALHPIRRIASAAALAALTALPASAAAQVESPALNGSFSAYGGWTATASCAPMCTVTNTLDLTTGAGAPGSATVIYTTLAGLLGGLASGTSTWTSPAFTWSAATPEEASLTFARKASIGGLLTVGGTASARIQLRDSTPARSRRS